VGELERIAAALESIAAAFERMEVREAAWDARQQQRENEAASWREATG
jgi:hypothetical protein